MLPLHLDLARPGIASATIAPHPAIMDQNLANPHRAMSINKFSTQHGEAHPPLGRICQLGHGGSGSRCIAFLGNSECCYKSFLLQLRNHLLLHWSSGVAKNATTHRE